FLFLRRDAALSRRSFPPRRSSDLGLVELWYRDPNRRFEDRDTRTARALAASVATSLENARLHDQTEARLVELSALNEISRALTQDRKSTRLNSSHVKISYAVFCLK